MPILHKHRGEQIEFPIWLRMDLQMVFQKSNGKSILQRKAIKELFKLSFMSIMVKYVLYFMKININSQLQKIFTSF